MSTITVGPGQQYSTISAAVAAASSGDTIDVEAGTYTNDFTTISQSLTLQAVGGTVTMTATQSPPNGKAIIDEGGPGVSVTIQGFDISGAQVSDGNGAGIRYEGGNLTLNNDTVHNNQEGLLSGADPNGNITISNSTFTANGSGDGATHDIYVGDINSLTVQNSTITDADVGHEIKSRAANNTITGNTITDGPNGTSSYEIDLPNGGNATITGNVIEKGPNAQNPHAISFGEEGGVYSSSSLDVSGNVMLNDDPSQSSTGVQNDTGVTASVTNNQVYGWNTVVSGSANASGNTTLTTEPALSSLSPSGSSGGTAAASGAASADASTQSTGDTTSTPDTSGSTTITTSTPDTSGSTATTSTPDTSGSTATTSTPDTSGSATITTSTPDTSGSATTTSTPDTSAATTGSAPITTDTVGTSTSTPSFTSGDTGSATSTSSSTPAAAASTTGGDQTTSSVTQAQVPAPTVGTTPSQTYAIGSSTIFPGWSHTLSHDYSAWHAMNVSTGSNA